MMMMMIHVMRKDIYSDKAKPVDANAHRPTGIQAHAQTDPSRILLYTCLDQRITMPDPFTYV